LKTVVEGGVITAGNASQLSDGASACVIMSSELAAKRSLTPLGRYLGMAVAGTEPDEMGIGPVFAVPRLLERFGLAMADIGPWELNEAFAVQVLYCQDRLGIPDEKAQCRRRRHFHWTSLRNVRGAHGGARLDRGQKTKGQARGRDDVCRGRDGSRGVI